jgi:hypothetical protein
MKKQVASNEQSFTKSGMLLGLVAYLAVVCLIGWVFF